jgi:hypothetical protein
MAKKKKAPKKKTTKKEEEPKEEPIKEEKPPEEPPAEDPPVVEPPAEEPPAEEPPKEEPPKEEPPKEKSLGDGWYDKILDMASGKLKDLPDPLEDAGGKAIDYFKENKADFINMGEELFERFIGFFSNGQKGKAKDLFIKSQLGPDDLIAAMRKSTAAMKKGTEKRNRLEEAANRFISLLTSLGCNVIKSLVFD